MMSKNTTWDQLCPETQDAQSLIGPVLLEACSQQTSQQLRRQRGCPATLSWAHLALAVVLHLLQGWRSRLEVWRHVQRVPMGPFAPVRVSNQAVYERLDRRGISIMQRLFGSRSLWLHLRLTAYAEHHLAPFAPVVVALDESVLDTMLRRFPHKEELGHRTAKATRLPPGRIAGLFDLRYQQWHRVDVVPDGHANCKVHAPLLLDGLPVGSLILFDRGYASFPWYDELTRRGYFWITRPAKATGYPLVHAYVQQDHLFDGLVRVGRSHKDRAASIVRLVRFRCKGRWHAYLSNVLDPLTLSAADIVRLYARRWDIELAFRLLQDHLHLHTHWSEKWEVLALQVWASLLIAQVYHALQVELAARAGVEVFDVSLALLVRWVPLMLAQHQDPMSVLLAQGRAIGLIRPSRRIPIEVPTLCLNEIVWPPDDLLLWQEPRYAHKQAGNRHRKPPSS